MFETLRDDVRTALAKDPAASSATAVALTYPGLHAIWLYRLAHALWASDHDFAARLVSHLSRLLTGVEIHPGAEVGNRLFIDHGMATVIGETAVVGDDVLLYHGVTLGGKSMRREKRHPTLEDGVTIGANATLIGPVTIGENATVGAGAVVVDDVSPETTVVGNPARPIDRENGDVDEEHSPAVTDGSGSEQ
ncbi:serine O-acetyltransferase [Haloarcula rara]|uniref:serine O-acetyltransferase n=1 Tax=Haloarcula rara TaxID=3033387 RepID=UPI0023E77436|nr:serine O-acetyltransferase [Halomicroarcula sp. SHR3]